MKLLTRLILFGVFFSSLLAILNFLYFEYETRKIPVKIKAKTSGSLRKTYPSFDFKSLFAKFYSKKESLPEETPSQTSPPVPPPRLRAVFWKKGSGLVLLDFGKEKIWAKKGEVVKGWKVENISPTSAVLSFNGEKVEIKLFKETQFNAKTPSKFNLKILSKSSRGKLRVFVISREELERLTSNIGSLFSKLGLRPYMWRGKIEGMKVVYLAPGSIFEKAGLKRGDIILTLNDIPIRTMEDAFRVFESLKTSSFIEAKIRRKGKILKIRVEVR